MDTTYLIEQGGWWFFFFCLVGFFSFLKDTFKVCVTVYLIEW